MDTKIYTRLQENAVRILASAIMGVEFIREAYDPLMYSYEGISVLEGLQQSLTLNLSAYLLPIFVCLPGVMRLSEERKEGYDQFCIYRIGISKYSFRKLFAGMLNGAGVILGAIGLYFVFAVFMAHISGKRINFSTQMLGNENWITLYSEWINKGMGWLVFVVNIIFLLFLAMFWNVVGVSISVFVSNRKLVVVAPFLFKRLLEYLIPEKWFFLNPVNLSMSGWIPDLPYGGIWYPFLYIYVSFLLGWLIVFLKLWYEVRIKK